MLLNRFSKMFDTRPMAASRGAYMGAVRIGQMGVSERCTELPASCQAQARGSVSA
jgi:hypothetical protein